MSMKNRAAIVVTVAVALAVLTGCSSTATDTPAPAKATTSVAPKPAAPQATASQAQALAAAKTYLSMGSGFSAASLLEQLTSANGNGFSQADAQWAIDHSGADWNGQAVDAAKGYMNLGTGFSRQTMIEQLTSTAGNQFTQAQAEYAADQVGLK